MGDTFKAHYLYYEQAKGTPIHLCLTPDFSLTGATGISNILFAAAEDAGEVYLLTAAHVIYKDGNLDTGVTIQPFASELYVKGHILHVFPFSQECPDIGIIQVPYSLKDLGHRFGAAWTSVNFEEAKGSITDREITVSHIPDCKGLFAGSRAFCFESLSEVASDRRSGNATGDSGKALFSEDCASYHGLFILHDDKNNYYSRPGTGIGDVLNQVIQGQTRPNHGFLNH